MLYYALHISHLFIYFDNNYIKRSFKQLKFKNKQFSLVLLYLISLTSKCSCEYFILSSHSITAFPSQ